MKVREALTFLLILLSSSATFGANYYDQPVFGEVKSIEVNSPFTSGRNVIIELMGSSGAVGLCGGSSGSGYINKSDNPDTYNSLLSLLLSAKATKNTIQVLTADGPEGCRIDQVRLK